MPHRRYTIGLRGTLRHRREPLCQRPMVALATTRDIRLDSLGLAALDVLVAEIARIGQQRPRPTYHLLPLIKASKRRRKLLLVIGVVADVLRHNQVAVDVHRRLRVVALHKALRGRHDARLLIGEVDLVLGPRSRHRRLRLPECDAELLFSDIELRFLTDYATAAALPAPRNLAGAVLLVALLGGYQNRNHDPPPGHPIMWRGYHRRGSGDDVNSKR